MIYVEILGRMGNQMFSYAHARYLQSIFQDEKIALDFTNFRNEDETWINYLQYFHCSKNIQIDRRKMNLLQKAALHLFFRIRNIRGGGYSQIYRDESKWAKIMALFDIYIFTNGYYPFHYRGYFKNKLLLGYFESQKYFIPIRDILIEDFQVTDFAKNTSAAELKKEIIQHREEVICVGVRKGDFVSNSNQAYCDICSPQYYLAGVNRIINLSDNAENWKAYIFTDDVSWAKEHLHFSIHTEYVTSSINGNLKPWEMLHIMTYFKYYVISNSTYFWWGQFLSCNSNRIVIAPSIWRSNDQDIYQDIYDSEWILINPDGNL